MAVAEELRRTVGRVDALQPAGILGTGFYVPPQIVTNDDLASRMDTSDEWIRTRTGIRERRVAAPDTATSDLAVAAGRHALENAGVEPEELDLIIVGTCTPDHPGSFPSTAALVQHGLGARRAGAFDLGAVCAGFTYALHVAAQMVRTGSMNRVLVIGAETMSRIVNWNDRNTAVLFGDGAGAVVIGATDEPGYLGGIVAADGSGAPLLNVPAGGSRRPLCRTRPEDGEGTIFQNGKEVYRFAVASMADGALAAMASVGISPADIDWFVPHQANIRIIAKAAERIQLPMEKVCVNIDRFGNTSSASIPIALHEAVAAGKIRKGSLIVTVGFGAGLTWGANVIRW
ncbi:MAG: beta-ketoacyl-ACP synthase III [Capsulimonadaceae bacterium]